MAVEVIDDNSTYADKLAKRHAKNCPDAVLVHAFFEGESQLGREAMHGLDVALERAASGQVVIVYGILPVKKKGQKEDPRILQLREMPNVAFADPRLFGCAIRVAYCRLKGLPVKIDPSPWLPWNSAVSDTRKLGWARQLEEAERKGGEPE